MDLSSSPLAVFPSHVPVWIVGGAVRDLLSTKEPHDWDLVVEGSIEEVHGLLGGSIVGPKGKQVCVCSRSGSVLEVGSIARGKIMADLARRDFTVNAMALDRQGRLLDPFGGVDDLFMKRLRFVPTLEDRLTEDPVRVLRFCRFLATLGFTPMEDEVSRVTSFAQENRQTLRDLPSHRIGREMARGLVYPRAFLDVLLASGLWDLWLPPLSLNMDRIPPGPMDLSLSLGLLSFLFDGDTWLDRDLSWGFPASTRRDGQGYRSLLSALSVDLSVVEAGRLLDIFDRLRSRGFMELLRWGSTGNLRWKEALDSIETARSRLDRASQKGIPLSGGEIAALIGPGPHVGSCLNLVVDRVLSEGDLSVDEVRSAVEAFKKAIVVR